MHERKSILLVGLFISRTPDKSAWLKSTCFVAPKSNIGGKWLQAIKSILLVGPFISRTPDKSAHLKSTVVVPLKSNTWGKFLHERKSIFVVGHFISRTPDKSVLCKSAYAMLLKSNIGGSIVLYSPERISVPITSIFKFTSDKSIPDKSKSPRTTKPSGKSCIE